MRPTHIDQHQHHGKSSICPPPLKISKDSHFIKKSSSSSCNNNNNSSPPQRHPVIIYTHSPKVIHTHPRDFMALVQKLTGLSRSNDHVTSSDANEEDMIINNKSNVKMISGGGGDDNESSSVITSDENCGGVGDGQVNSSSCFVPPPMFDAHHPNPYLTNIPVFTPNSADFLCSNQPFYNFTTDSLFFPPNINIRGAGASSTPESRSTNHQ